MTSVLLLFLAVSAPAAPLPALREGSVLFFRGDLEGAVESWKAAREAGGSREFDALLSSALTALGKSDLSRGRYSGARRRFAEALAIDPGNKTLRRLSLLAELGEQTGGLRTLKHEETDATEEMDRLLTALLLLDRPAAPAAPAASVAVAVSTAVAASTVPVAAAPPPSSVPAASAKNRQQAQILYERGLESYYAGAYDKAQGLFYAALRLDPKQEKARRAVKLVTAALHRREAEQRYQEALRAFYVGDARLARAKLQEALMLDPGHVKARETLAHLATAAPPPSGQ